AQDVFEEVLERDAVEVEDVGLRPRRGIAGLVSRRRCRPPRGRFGRCGGEDDIDGVVAGGHRLVLRADQRAWTSVAGKKYAISFAAFSRLSEPCTALASMLSAKSARMVPAAASFGLVAPIRSRFFSTAPSPSSTWIITGPEIMNSTSAPKNGRSRWTA